MSMRETLVHTFAYMPPARALDGLTGDDAARRVAGVNHSIVEIVAHINFWQSWFLRRCDGDAEPMVAAAADGWPGVEGVVEWNTLRATFLDGLERAAALSEDPGRLEASIAPAIEFPPLGNYTMRDVLVHVAVHNAHHLGQVVTLRQMLGRWPPPEGSWTW